jgi:DNA polymerase-1
MPKKLLRYRHLAKLKSTYVDALPRMVHPITGRVHTSYSQVVAITGRLSSNDPNLQNIPIRSTEGGQIRKAFVAGHPGWLLVSADYSQIELRVMAHLAGDEKLIQAFNEGVDIHRMTAAWMHDMPPELITSDMRRQAKEVNFGVLYGMGAFGLAQRLGITRKRAQEFITQYFEKFARVKEFITETIETARKNGFVETMAGRRRPLPDLSANNHISRMNAERIAINTPIQGSAADLMKIAMINVHDALQKENLKSKMLLQVHDELVFEAPPEELETLNNLVRTGMSAAMELKVPLDVDISWGNNWLEAHE